MAENRLTVPSLNFTSTISSFTELLLAGKTVPVPNVLCTTDDPTGKNQVESNDLSSSCEVAGAGDRVRRVDCAIPPPWDGDVIGVRTSTRVTGFPLLYTDVVPSKGLALKGWATGLGKMRGRIVDVKCGRAEGAVLLAELLDPVDDFVCNKGAETGDLLLA